LLRLTLVNSLAFVGLVFAGFRVVGLDFFANSGVLFLEDGLPPILYAIMEMHLTSMAGYNWARTAGSKNNQ
jgi:hypothetical protein